MQSTISNKFSQYQQRQPASVVVSLSSLPHSHPKIYMHNASYTTLTSRESFEANIHHHKWRKALGQYELYIHITGTTDIQIFSNELYLFGEVIKGEISC